MLCVLAPTFEPVLQQMKLQGFFFVGGKTLNIAIKLVLRQSRKTSCTFFCCPFHRAYVSEAT